MIPDRYQVTDILKETEQKAILRVQQFTKDNKKKIFVVKKISNSKQKKYFDNELEIYNIVLKDSHSKGFAELKDIQQDKDWSYLVLDELGENLEIFRKRTGGRFSLKTVLMIGVQALQRIEYFHSKGYVHADIQPSNFVIGFGKLSHKIYLIDFQISTPYFVNEKHIKEQILQNFSGSIKFCSIQANNHKNTSRRDDIESLLYSLIFLIKGYLPWSELKSQTMIQAYDETAKLKKQKVAELLEGLPDIFGMILEYTRGLKFEQRPDYDKIRRHLCGLMKKNGYDMDYKYDWTFV